MRLTDLPLALTVTQTAEALSIGRTKAWELVRSGEIAPVTRLGHAVRVPRWVVAHLLGLDDPDDGHGLGLAHDDDGAA